MNVPGVPRPNPGGQHLHEDEEHPTRQGEERWDDVGQDARRQHDGGPAPVPARAQSASHQTEEEQGQRDAQRVGVFTGQGGEEVPPVDGERVIEEVAQGEGGYRAGIGPAHPEEPSHGPRGDGEQHGPEHRDPLERHRVGDDVTGQGGQQVRQDEVIGVEGEAVVPARVPTGQLAVGEESGPQEGRHGEVAAIVTAGGCRGGDEQARVELPEHDHNHRDDAHDGGRRRHPPRGGPPPRPAVAGGTMGGRVHLFCARPPDRAGQWTPPR